MTSVWYVLGDPFGINNMYVALFAPAIFMILERLLPAKKDKDVVHKIQNSGA